MSTDEEDGAPGWEAIEGALKRLYPEITPFHAAPPLPAIAGGEDPLDGVSAYRSQYGGTPHWHFITFGYSELYQKETDDPAVSGFGFEMSLRLVDPEATDSPPAWAVSLLQNLARYVFRTGNAFGQGHHTTLNGPIALGRQTLLTAAAFCLDPELGRIETPNGAVEVLQLVGLTGDEYGATKDWDTRKFLAVVAEQDRALLTTLDRASWLDDPSVAARVKAGIAKDGSSMELFYSTKGSFELSSGSILLGVAANGLDDLRRILRGRLAFGKSGAMAWPSGGVELVPGPATAATGDSTLCLEPQDIQAILEIPVRRGDYPLPSGRGSVRVLPVEIYDGARKKVLEVIG
ncbi:MAG: suppressor of fused domain protein [Myxococcota bacterium]